MAKKIMDKNEKPSFFQWGFHILDKWLQIKNSGRALETYFEDNSIHCVAIYGLGAIGKRLYEELRQSRIEVSCGIDKNAANIHIEGLEVKTPEDNLPEVDAVIVTPVDFYEIQKNLYRKLGKDIDIIFIEDVVEYCFNLP